jgi:hypothetical protein
LKTKYGNVKINTQGYYRISSKKEKNHDKYLHRLIWEETNGEIPEGYIIHHIDGNPLNNDIKNLECMTHSKHTILHHKGKKHFEETKKKISKWDLTPFHEWIMWLRFDCKFSYKIIHQILGLNCSQSTLIRYINNLKSKGGVYD